MNGVQPGKGQIEQAAWAKFCEQMKQVDPSGISSYHETRVAWAWFLRGWMCHIEGPRHA